MSSNLIAIIADIRMKTGVGAKPMLDELADAVAKRITEARRGGRREGTRLAAERIAIMADNARRMSKDEKAFNKFERRDFESMAIAYAQAAHSILHGAGEGAQP